MGALNALSSTGSALSQSIQRLSTGMQINSASDNPSGLVISQKFENQLSGISAALNNGQNAVNMMKTADGAMGQISTLLQSAYSLAVDASNSGVNSSSQNAADNQQLTAIVNSINTIASNTQFGSKYLLNGSAGVSSAVTNGADISSLNIGGNFNAVALTAGGAAVLTVNTAATQAIATLTGTFATAGSAVAAAGQFTINGDTFTATASDTATTLINSINQATGQTGVTASYDAASKHIVLLSTNYGSSSKINVADANGVVLSAAGSIATASGVDAVAHVSINGGASVVFTAGLNGNDGLTMTDGDGNTFKLTTAGNTTATAGATVGQVSVGSDQFQIGGNSGQTASFSLGNFAASQLGGSAVAGQNMSTINLTTGTNASTAMQVISAAIGQIATSRGSLGAFQSDTLQSNMSVLGVAQQNLTAANSSIVDTNVAQEMTNFTKLQVLQQAGMSVLSQANMASQNLLSLIKNG
jgi:flagellin